MTSKTALVISVISSIIFISPALAVDSTTSGAAANNRKQLVQQKLETKKENVENKILAAKERIASKEATLKLRLQQFKDQKKAQIAGRVSTNLNKINQNQTDQMRKHLEVMTRILDKLQTRVTNRTPDIKDPAVAKAAIASASAAIASASAAVAAQAQNDYTVQVTTEAAIKAALQAQRQKLHADLKNVRSLIIDAKQTVANAIRVAKSGKIEKEATTSGQQ